MPHRASIRQHATIVYSIDELSLGVGFNKHGHEFDLCVYAYGSAEIAYDRDGDWDIIGLSIYGTRRAYDGKGGWLKNEIELPKESPIYPLVIAALHANSWQDIGDRVEDALASERECV